MVEVSVLSGFWNFGIRRVGAIMALWLFFSCFTASLLESVIKLAPIRKVWLYSTRLFSLSGNRIPLRTHVLRSFTSASALQFSNFTTTTTMNPLSLTETDEVNQPTATYVYTESASGPGHAKGRVDRIV